MKTIRRLGILWLIAAFTLSSAACNSDDDEPKVIFEPKGELIVTPIPDDAETYKVIVSDTGMKISLGINIALSYSILAIIPLICQVNIFKYWTKPEMYLEIKRHILQHSRIMCL